ncbi:MAG: DUF2786 domain-containing protein [Methylococcales bacterium]
MIENYKKIAEKIAKCLALAQSENANEAEAALRQAKALMEKYNLTASDVAASKVSECDSKTSSKKRPSAHIANLALVVADVFGCEVLTTKYHADKTAIRFIGVLAKPEMASYTFEVLQRHLKRDRRQYLATLSSYRSTKTRQGDLFCLAWVDKITTQVKAFANITDAEAIKLYMDGHYKNLSIAAQRKRSFKGDDYGAWIAGQVAAQNVSLYQPVQTKGSLFIE